MAPALDGALFVKAHPHTFTWAEQWVDRVIHWVGLCAAAVGFVVLLLMAADATDGSPLLWASLVIYGVGLLGMLGCSAVNNHDFGERSRWAELFARLDHAGILLMIAATYTPLALHMLGGLGGVLLCLVVWSGALVGMAVQLIARGPVPMRWSLGLYVLLGWCGIVALQPLLSSASLTVLGLILCGGVLYSLGIPFFLWRRLPYNRAIWHAFVVAGAACHYVAVLLGVVLGGGLAASQ